MAKQKKQTDKKPGGHAKKREIQPLLSKDKLPPKWRWLLDERFLVPFALYLIMLGVWYKCVFEGMGLNLTPDRISAISLRRIAAMWLEEGVFPYWNPYFYGGMAMFESFQSSWLWNPMVWVSEGFIRDAAQPGFYNGGLGWLLFFGSPVDFILLHHLIGAVGVAWLIRHLGGSAWVQLLGGIAFLLSPQLVVLGDVGHGSKLYAMCFLPWMLLALDRAFDKPTLGRLGLLGLAFTLLMFTQHIQVAYYGYMLAGLWFVARVVRNLKRRQGRRIPMEALMLAVGGLLGVIATGVIYFNTLTYSHDTIRGAEGVTWEYATNWSFHPQESWSLLFPEFYGFGGQTYWGYMPFTDMPLYWGAPILVLAVIALIGRRRDWRIWALFVAGMLAWATSWGKHGPVLYQLFYDYLPYFNKFRVPMMIHILVLLSAVVLAGMGLQRMFDLRNAEEELRKKWGKGLLYSLATAGVLLLLAGVLQGFLSDNIAGMVASVKPRAVQISDRLGDMAAESILRTLVFVHLTLVTLWLVVWKRWAPWTGGLILAVMLVLDLAPLATRLLHPQPVGRINAYFQKDKVVEKLQEAPRGRLLPVDRTRVTNTWGAFGIEQQGGYTGSKSAAYGYLEEKEALMKPPVLSIFNVRYIYSGQPLQGWQPWYSGRGGNLYAMPGLDRVFLRGDWEVVPETELALDRISSERFNPNTTLLLDREPSIAQVDSLQGSAEITDWNPNQVVIKTQSDHPAVLVLLDAYSSAGWTATVNGELAEIMRSYGMMRAVGVPAGEAEVEFVYRPAHWGPALALSSVGWVVILALSIGGPLLARRAKKTPSSETVEADEQA